MLYCSMKGLHDKDLAFQRFVFCVCEREKKREREERCRVQQRII